MLSAAGFDFKNQSNKRFMDFNPKLKILTLLMIFIPFAAFADSLAERVAGYILLQVEQNGEAWYVNPVDAKRYFLGRPDDAFGLMRKFGIGALNRDLEKIPIGLLEGFAISDSDQDGLGDRLEDAIGTDKNDKDSDDDGYDDLTEVKNSRNPVGQAVQNIDLNLANNNSGRILIQVEKNGEAWYINPKDDKRYYLGRPSDAFDVMRGLGLGISDIDLKEISPQPTPNPDTAKKTAEQVLEEAGLAIISGNTEETLKYFTARMQTPVAFTMDYLSDETRFSLGNFIAGAKFLSSSDDKDVYANQIYFSGEMIDVEFNLIKNSEGIWLLDNL